MPQWRRKTDTSPTALASLCYIELVDSLTKMAVLEQKTDAVTPKVGIIIINWNGLADTLSCLESLRRCDYTNKKIFVVDNASSDGSGAELKRFLYPFELIQSKLNLGWAGGNNLGIKHAQSNGCTLFYLLNNDCQVKPDTLSQLVNAAQTLPDWAFLGSTVFDDPNSTEPTFYGASWSKFDGTPRSLKEDGAPCPQTEEPFSSTMVHGCSMMTSSVTLQKIGFIDERFFLNFDETDWCARAFDVDRKAYVVPRSMVNHRGSGTIGGWLTPLNQYFITRNRLLYAAKHLPLRKLLLCLRTSIWMIEALQGNGGKTRALLALVFGSTHQTIAAIRRGIFDFCTARFGDCPDSIRQLHIEYKNQKR